MSFQIGEGKYTRASALEAAGMLALQDHEEKRRADVSTQQTVKEEKKKFQWEHVRLAPASPLGPTRTRM